MSAEEYFAQGVTYYLVPADSPARFGATRERLLDIDPMLFEFVDTIARAEVEAEDMLCPL